MIVSKFILTVVVVLNPFGTVGLKECRSRIWALGVPGFVHLTLCEALASPARLWVLAAPSVERGLEFPFRLPRRRAAHKAAGW